MRSSIPQGWRWSRIGEQCQRVTRKNSAGVTRVLTASGEHGLINQEEFFNKRVAARNVEKYYHLKRGEFTYNRSSMNGYPCGAIKRLERYDEGVLSTLYLCFGLKPNASIVPNYAAQLFDSGLLDTELRPIARVGARAHGLLNVTPADFMEVPFPLPPLSEQKKIAAILSAVDEAIQATQAVMQQTRRVKEGLFQDLLTNDGWSSERIDDVGDAQLGQQRHPKFATGTNVRPYLRVANVLDGCIDFDNLNEMHFPQKDLPKFELRAGDILLNEGQSVHLVGRSAVYGGEVPGLCMQKTLLRYRCGPRLLPYFAQAVFQWWLWSGHFADVSVQTTSMAHLTGVRFNRMQIPVPSLAEQQQIVAIIGSVNEVKRHAVEARIRYQELKTGLFQDLLTGKVRVSA